MRIRSFSALILLAIAFTQCSEPQPPAKATSLLPVDAPLYMRINDVEDFKAIIDTANISYLNALPVAALSELTKGTWTGALLPSGASTYNWVWTTENDLSIHVTENIKIGTYEAFKIDSLFAYNDGPSWVVSPNEGLIQDIINLRGTGYSLMEDDGFKTLWQNASKSDDANLFVQHKNLEQAGKYFFDQDWAWAQHFAQWSSIDLTWKKNKLIATAVALCADSTNTYLSTFKQRASDNDFSEIIAASTKYALGVNTGDMAEWLREFNGYRGRKQRLKSAQKTLEAANVSPMTFANSFEGRTVRIGYGDGTVLATKLKKDDQNVLLALQGLSSGLSIFQGHQRGVLQDDHRFLFSAAFCWILSDPGTASWMVWEDWLLLSSDGQLLDV